jgi:alpha-galactosidase
MPATRSALVTRARHGRCALPLTTCVLTVAILATACATPAARTTSEAPPAQARPEALPEARLVLPPNAIWLESLDLAAIEQSWGTPRAARSIDDHPLTLGGKIYRHGVGTHAASEMIVDLNGCARGFRATVGVDAEVAEHGSIVFVVIADGRERQRTPVLRGGEPPAEIDVDLSGVQELVLVVEDAGDYINYDHADWAGAMLLLASGAKTRPTARLVPPGPDLQIAKETPLRPAIHAPRITGATPGRPFLFRIPATGGPPLRFAAENLPAGLTLDLETGIITGALSGAGTTDVTVTVSGPHGMATSVLTIVGGEHSLALTPPMGWNSWNVWGPDVDDAKVRSAADWMVRSGLAAHGYRYINIDDAWEAERDADGRILPNEKFPDMKALADYVHAQGLKLGIYSSPGTKTCGGYEGSYEHEQLDAQTYAEWGVDFLKYDWCSYEHIAADHSLPELRKPYEIMRAALDACGRDIVYSLCQYGMGDVSEWGADVGGNLWRTTGDIFDSWESMASIGFNQAGLEPYAGPGQWNDPDMLVVGKVGWSANLHDTRLNVNEQITHITLWSLLAAPLLIGCDLSQLDDFTLALLTNPEVLEVNQDRLGRQAARVFDSGKQEVWSRPLADGTIAVGLFNRGRGVVPIVARWDELGLSGPQPVRDLWRRTDLGVFEAGCIMEVPRHGVVMLKIGTPKQ